MILGIFMGIIVGCEGGIMLRRILALDPSGTGTTGICLINKKITFQEFRSPYRIKHLNFIKEVVEGYGPDLVLYENTHYLKEKTQDGLNLFRLLGAIESLPIKTEYVLASQIKDLRKQLFKGTKTIPNLTFKLGKGWFYQQQKISVHELDAFLVYWLWKEQHA